MGVAQLVEHRVVVPVAAGSSPVAHPNRFPMKRNDRSGGTYQGRSARQEHTIEGTPQQRKAPRTTQTRYGRNLGEIHGSKKGAGLKN